MEFSADQNRFSTFSLGSYISLRFLKPWKSRAQLLTQGVLTPQQALNKE